jgi:nuclear transcription Y subunit beta
VLEKVEKQMHHQDDDMSDRMMGISGMPGGIMQNPHSSETREQDRFLPVANIARIMKTVLPPNAKIGKDAKETIQECVSEFISFITSEASDKCVQEKRKTINGDDILWAMSTLGFDPYIAPLETYLSKYREVAKADKPEKKGKPGDSQEGTYHAALPVSQTTTSHSLNLVVPPPPTHLGLPSSSSSNSNIINSGVLLHQSNVQSQHHYSQHTLSNSSQHLPSNVNSTTLTTNPSSGMYTTNSMGNIGIKSNAPSYLVSGELPNALMNHTTNMPQNTSNISSMTTTTSSVPTSMISDYQNVKKRDNTAIYYTPITGAGKFHEFQIEQILLIFYKIDIETIAEPKVNEMVMPPDKKNKF